MSIWHRPCFAFIAIWLSSCGAGNDSTATVEGAAATVCGEAGSGFVLRITGGQKGLELFCEMGHLYAVIGPSCRFTVSDTTHDHLGAAVEGSLTDEQVEELSALLAIEDWDDLEPLYGTSLCDGSAVRYAVGDRVFDIIPFCPVSPIPGPSNDFRQAAEGVDEVIARLRTLGEPASGPVRYVLYRTTSTHPRYGGAPEWPLDVSVDVASMTTLSEGPPFLTIPVIQVAEGEDAGRLRALRTEFLESDTPFPAGALIPIKEPMALDSTSMSATSSSSRTPRGRPSCRGLTSTSRCVM